ncbi:DUF4386 domain-containing protein [Litorilituus lipolyticus]|uniref:DUF4386 domain-containing protein n=1 Tax=Litorilituus lipolyticus TaxID=2491017 RepID=A0A502KWC0_9GAMM|nr:DUF4386 domain-containing protein [Litorilituus lipolyticus]TPH13973.1 DUF4386 domain-containing protein [Litorilituus lipolyticus]
MNTKTTQNLQYFYAKLAGLSYILFTVAGLIKNFFLNTQLSAVSAIPINGLFENELQFRLGIFAEIFMFVAVTLASISFFIVLKPVNARLAKTTLCFRLVEIIIGSVAVVFSMTMLAISNKVYLSEMFNVEQIHTLIVITSSVIVPAYEYSWIFMGVAGIITFYLLFRARYIPTFWAIWGVITYTSLILYPVAKLTIADLPREVMYIMFPGALFELGVGIWLLTKGIRIPENSNNGS